MGLSPTGVEGPGYSPRDGEKLAILIRVAGVVRRYPVRLTIALAAMFVATASILAMPWFFGSALDVLITPDGIELETGATAAGFLVDQQTGVTPVLLAGLAITAIGVMRCACVVGRVYASAGLLHRVAADCRNRLYEKCQSASGDFYDRAHTGRLMSVATVDIDNVSILVNAGLLGLADILLRLLVIPVLMFLFSWQLALVCLAGISLLVVSGSAMYRELRGHWASIQAATAKLTVVLQDNLAGMRVVKAFAAEDYERSKYDRKALELRSAFARMVNVQRTRRAWLGMYFAVVVGVVMWWDGLPVVRGTVTLGELVAFIAYLMLLAAPIRGMGQVVGAFARGVTSGRRLFRILDAPSSIKERPGAVDPRRVAGSVKFDGVVFGYEKGFPVLRGLDLEVKPGELTVITGGFG